MDTVTISLERYKELEVYEQAMKLRDSIEKLEEEKAKLENAIKEGNVKVVTKYPAMYPGSYDLTSYRIEDELINDIVSHRTDQAKESIRIRYEGKNKEEIQNIIDKLRHIPKRSLIKFIKSDPSYSDWVIKLAGKGYE